MGTFQRSSAVACALALLSPAAGPAAQAPQGGPPIKVVAGELSQNPQLFHGATVTVRAEVEHVLSPNLFTLDEDRVLSAGKDVLVFVARPDAVPLEGKTVTVTGIVRPFVQTEFVRDFDWFYPDPDLFARFHSRPVIFATSGLTESGKELMRATAPSTQETPSRATTIAAGDLADAPERFLGRRVTVKAEVEQVFGPRMFTLDEDKFFSSGRDVLVLMNEAEAVPMDGAWVTVTGTVRPFVRTDIERSFSWLTLDPGLWVRFERRPAIVAESVRTAAGAELVGPGAELSAKESEDETSAPETAIADFGAIVNAPDAGSMVGLRAELSGATVQGIAGPRSFWIGGATGPQVFIVVNGATIQAVTPGNVDLGPGTRVSITGDIKRLPGTEGKVTVTDWGVPPADAEKLKTQQLYVYATRVEVQSAPATTPTPSGTNVVGTTGENTVGTTGDAGGTRQTDASARSIRIVGRDYRFEPRELTVAPGQQVRLELANEGTHPHGIELHLEDTEAELVSPVSVGASGSLTFTAPSAPGKYVFYCPVGNHRAEGMEGTLVVR